MIELNLEKVMEKFYINRPLSVQEKEMLLIHARAHKCMMSYYFETQNMGSCYCVKSRKVTIISFITLTELTYLSNMDDERKPVSYEEFINRISKS